jgi:hypothetical protein
MPSSRFRPRPLKLTRPFAATGPGEVCEKLAGPTSIVINLSEEMFLNVFRFYYSKLGCVEIFFCEAMLEALLPNGTPIIIFCAA